jgi:light-regulated signal transduction histidine kinase (bacteriophytochrome)
MNIEVKCLRSLSGWSALDPCPTEGARLEIVNRIIDRRGGRVWVESTPGEGSTFFFTLPAA